MSLNPSIFKAYDIRGIYPTDLDEEGLGIIIRAIYSFFVADLGKDNLQIALGRDMRVSSPALFEVAKKVLVEMGAGVIDIGLVSTPTFYFSVLHEKYDAGIQISASHNPKEYNGIKFVKRVGDKLLKIGKSTGMDEVKRRALGNDFVEPSAGGSVAQDQNVLKKEVDFAIETLGVTELRPLKIVADPANAMGALYIEELFKRFPIELVKMNFELDGTFPSHQPDPLQFELLKDLQKKVIDEKADLGIAPDGDGDRIFFIDEKGQIIYPTFITSLISSEIFKKEPEAKIVVDIRYLRNVINVCKKYGENNYAVSPVGHAYITEIVNKEEAAFAGESSSHFFFKEVGGAESAIMAILYVLKAMYEQNKPVSDVLAQYRTYYESSEFNFVVEDSKSLLEQIGKQYADGEVNLLDGLSVDYPEWRFNIRTSNTEPLVRLNLEASSENLMKEKLEEILQKLKSAGAKPK